MPWTAAKIRLQEKSPLADNRNAGVRSELAEPSVTDDEDEDEGQELERVHESDYTCEVPESGYTYDLSL